MEEAKTLIKVIDTYIAAKVRLGEMSKFEAEVMVGQVKQAAPNAIASLQKEEPPAPLEEAN